MKLSGICLSILACMLAAGCALDAAGEIDDSEGAEDSGGEELEQAESTGIVADTMRRDCVIGCPAGWHPIDYYCNNCGGGTCSFAYDSQVCERDHVPSFDTCVLNGCPGGYEKAHDKCKQDCGASPTAMCSTGNPNATHCVAMPSLDAVTDTQGQLPIRVGQPISLWGQRFEPGGMRVRLMQQQGNVAAIWWLPDQDGSYWWNGNESQINTIVPSNVWANQPLLIDVWTSEAKNATKWITPAP
jgi:hypothetical protein